MNFCLYGKLFNGLFGWVVKTRFAAIKLNIIQCGDKDTGERTAHWRSNKTLCNQSWASGDYDGRAKDPK